MKKDKLVIILSVLLILSIIIIFCLISNNNNKIEQFSFLTVGTWNEAYNSTKANALCERMANKIFVCEGYPGGHYQCDLGWNEERKSNEIGEGKCVRYASSSTEDSKRLKYIKCTCYLDKLLHN